MNHNKNKVAALLRRKAEKQLLLKQREGHSLTVIDDLKIIRELQVHQIELEMQNEELVLACMAAESEKVKYSNLYNFAPSGYLTLSKDCKILRLNYAAAAILKKETKYLLNKDFSKFLDGESRKIFAIFFKKMLESKSKETCEIAVISAEGIHTYFHITGEYSNAEEHCQLTVVDITEHELAENTLITKQFLIQEITDNINSLIYALDLQGRILMVNKKFETLFGVPREEIIGKTREAFLPPEIIELHTANDLMVVQERRSITIEEETREPDGIHIYSSTKFPLFDSKGKIYGIFGISTDITEMKTANRLALNSKIQLEQLTAHLTQVREEERKAIVREIHDELGQSLAAIKLDLFGLKENNGTVESLKNIDRSISLINTTMKCVHNIVSTLRPPLLDDLGLKMAIDWQLNEFKERVQIKCKFEIDEIDEIEETISISILRILQESLTNIIRHANATEVTVKLSLKNGMIMLAIIDNGIGISQEQINSYKSFGIIGIRERLRQINGNIEIHSTENKGTELLLKIPIEREKQI